MRLILLWVSILFTAIGQAQTCDSTAGEPTTPTSRFSDHGDGTVTDKLTGLMWKQCMQGKIGVDCGNSDGGQYAMRWPNALAQPQSINADGGFAGYTDWRLPNINELSTIVELQCRRPSINLNVFPNDFGNYVWSSSPSAKITHFSWAVYFRNGSISVVSRSNSGQNGLPQESRSVRLVRDGG